jgi:hypothetical protein
VTGIGITRAWPSPRNLVTGGNSLCILKPPTSLPPDIFSVFIGLFSAFFLLLIFPGKAKKGSPLFVEYKRNEMELPRGNQSKDDVDLLQRLL